MLKLLKLSFVVFAAIQLFSSHIRVLAADPAGERGSAHTSRPSTELSYVIKVTEFRWKDAESERFDSAESLLRQFDELKQDADFEHVQTIRFAAVENTESFVQFETEKPVVVGMQRTGKGGRQRVTAKTNVGTIVRARFAREGERILMDFDYEVRRFTDEGTDTTPPTTRATKFQVVLSLLPGEPAFVAGQSGTNSSFVILTLEP